MIPTEVCCFIVSDHGGYESVWFYLSASLCLDLTARLMRIRGIVSIELFDDRCASSKAICWKWTKSAPLHKTRPRKRQEIPNG